MKLAVSMALVLSLSPAALAEVNSETVRYAELDLAKDAGVTELYRRLQNAAEKVCGVGASTAFSVAHRREQTACYDAALSSAVAKLNLPEIKRVHAENVG